MKGYLGNNIRCIYLDQFATSGLFDPSNSIEWNEIRELIISCVNKGRIICPMSFEHFLETSQKDSTRAKILDNQFHELSKGYGFKSEVFITAQLMISLIRKNNLTSNTFLHKNIKRSVLSDRNNIELFSTLKNKLNQNIDEASVHSNKIREITRQNNMEVKVRKDLINTCKALAVNNFINRLNDLLVQGQIIIRAINFSSGDVPHWIDLIIHRLTEKHCMNIKETKMLIEHLEKNGFNEISTLDLRTSIEALIAVYHKKETANDQIDIMRISTSFQISDILLIDKQRKNEIIEIGLDKKYNTTVLCGTEKDLKIFIHQLKEINE
jgi:hypothetical protein